MIDFGAALAALRNGERVYRSGWNGKGMYIYLVSEWLSRGDGNRVHLPFIAMKTADDKYVPWLASQTDLLANDWEVVP